MVPGLTSVSASEIADITRVVASPVVEPQQVQSAPPQPDKDEAFKPVRIGALYEVGGSQAAPAESAQRAALDQHTNRVAADDAVDARVLQQKLYGFF